MFNAWQFHVLAYRSSFWPRLAGFLFLATAALLVTDVCTWRVAGAGRRIAPRLAVMAAACLSLVPCAGTAAAVVRDLEITLPASRRADGLTVVALSDCTWARCSPALGVEPD